LEIVIIDDDSPDETWKLVKELNHPKVELIHRTKKRGLASAIAEGVEEARGEIVVWMDCDLGIPPEEIDSLIGKLDVYDVSIGSRFVNNGVDNRKMWISTASYLLNLFAQIVLGNQVRDYTSGFIAVRRHVLNRIRINPKGFGEYFIEFVYRCYKENFKITEVGYVYGNRKGGVSKSTDNILVFIRLGLGYLKKIVDLKFYGL